MTQFNNAYETLFDYLKQEAKELGYKVNPTTLSPYVRKPTKTIYLQYWKKTAENLYCFCHELGHARCCINLNRKYKVLRIVDEVIAWVLGCKFVRKYKLPKPDYIKSAKMHLRSYIGNK